MAAAAAAKNLGQPKRWWSYVRPPITAEYNSEQSYRYYQAYGWAQARLQSNTVMPHQRIEEIASFYDAQQTDDAWRDYSIDYLTHAPFNAMPAWETVATRLNEILDDPLVLVEYIGVRAHGDVNKIPWCKVGHACHFILRLLWARLQHEDTVLSDEEKKTMVWAPLDRWAAAHVLYTLLCSFQDAEARRFRDAHHQHYAREYRASEKDGGVNPVVEQPAGLSPEQYQQQMVELDSSFLGRLAAYFRAMP